MPLFWDIKLDGEDLGITFCRSCAVRHVYYTLLTKRGIEHLSVSEVKENMTETETTLVFRTPPCASKS